MLFLVLIPCLVLAFAAPAFAGQVVVGPPPGGYTPNASATGDPELPGADPNCQVCHGEVENNYNPWMAEESTSAQTSTLRNIVRFRNLYALEAMKVEKESSSTTGAPIIDVGNGSPLTPAMGYFWTRIASNAPYYERYSWSQFNGQNVPVNFSSNAMQVKVWDNSAATPWMSSAFNHPLSTPPHNSIPTTWQPINWEKVELKITPPWAAPPGIYQSTLDIVVTQI